MVVVRARSLARENKIEKALNRSQEKLEKAWSSSSEQLGEEFRRSLKQELRETWSRS